MPLVRKRHDKIVDILIDFIKKKVENKEDWTITKEGRFEFCTSLDQYPDIICRNDKTKKYFIIDVKCPEDTEERMIIVDRENTKNTNH